MTSLHTFGAFPAMPTRKHAALLDTGAFQARQHGDCRFRITWESTQHDPSQRSTSTVFLHGLLQCKFEFTLEFVVRNHAKYTACLVPSLKENYFVPRFRQGTDTNLPKSVVTMLQKSSTPCCQALSLLIMQAIKFRRTKNKTCAQRARVTWTYQVTVNT